MATTVGPGELDVGQPPHVHGRRLRNRETARIDEFLDDLDQYDELPRRRPWVRAVAVVAAAALVIPLVIAAVDAVTS